MSRQTQIKADAKEMVEKFSRIVNCFNDTEVAEVISDCIMKEHRTLQQAMMRVFMHQIKVWSETPFYDLRNEDTIKLSKKIMKNIDKEMFLPYT